MNKSSKIISLVLMFGLVLSACANASKGKTLKYALKTAIVDGKMAYIGVGGEIDGVENPTLSANTGDQVEVTLTSGEGTEHDISFPDFSATSEHVASQGQGVTVSFFKGRPFAQAVMVCQISTCPRV